MNIEEIKKAVLDGNIVYWSNINYMVVVDRIGQWLIWCMGNDHCIGLTSQDGKILNGDESEFFIKNN